MTTGIIGTNEQTCLAQVRMLCWDLRLVKFRFCLFGCKVRDFGQWTGMVLKAKIKR